MFRSCCGLRYMNTLEYKMKNRLSKSLFLGVIIAVSGMPASADMGEQYSSASYAYTAAPGTTLTVGDHFVWAWATAAFIPDPECCGDGPRDDLFDVDADFAPFSAAAGAGAGCFDTGGAGSTSTSISNFTNLGPSIISWEGLWIGDGDAGICDFALCTASGGYGSFVDFTSDGDFTITPPTCTSSSSSSPTRTVDANIICLDSGPVAAFTVSQGGQSTSTCGGNPISLGAGSYTINTVYITIDDVEHDVTADGRFNQDDVDFLVNSVLGTPLASDILYTDRFDFDGNGVVDNADIDVVQCFVDACLDARRIGDANCDNVIDCDDLSLALSQPFAGESFTGTVYNVGFDTDLDGDNDAADKAIIAERMLQVEPANLIFDNALDFFDIAEFLNLLTAQDPKADFNGDGSIDFFDQQIFLNAMSNPQCFAP